MTTPQEQPDGHTKGLPCLIYDDPRLIDSIWYDGEDTGGWKVGGVNYGCDHIAAYREHGQGDFVPYFAVYCGQEIIARVPAHMVTVHYAKALGQ